MMTEQDMLVPMIIGEVRDQMEALGYMRPEVVAAGGQITVKLANGRSASVDVPVIHNVFDVSTDISEELHSLLTG